MLPGWMRDDCSGGAPAARRSFPPCPPAPLPLALLPPPNAFEGKSLLVAEPGTPGVSERGWRFMAALEMMTPDGGLLIDWERERGRCEVEVEEV